MLSFIKLLFHELSLWNFGKMLLPWLKKKSVLTVTHFANPTVDHNLFLKRFCNISVNIMTARTP